MRFLKDVTHRRWRRDLSPFIDGQMELSRREALERHLATCAFCQEELASLRQVVALLRRVPQVEASRSFALTQAPSVRLRWPVMYGSSIRYATAVAAMLLLAVVVADLVTGRPAALAPASPGPANVQLDKGSEESEGTRAAATAAPLAGSQDIAQATPTPQPLPLAASEKAQDTGEAEVSPAITPSKSGTLHNWLRWGEIAIGALLAVLVSVVSVQWWLGRRQRQC